MHGFSREGSHGFWPRYREDSYFRPTSRMLSSRRRGTLAELYKGYAPSNVARDAKYSIRRDLDGEMKVHLIYRSGHRERALLSTDLHLALVHMVNDVKIEV